MKQFLFRFFALLISLIIFFGIGEVMFRIFRGHTNPLTDTTQIQPEYLFEPGTTKEGKSQVEGEFDYTAHINKYGYRGKDFDMPKKEGVVRIFAVGDSFTYGVGAEDSETIPYRLEAELSERGVQAEVINAGIGHASPIQHYVNLRDIHLKYEPDLVILLLDLTDLWDDWNRERSAVFDKNGEILYFDPTYVNGKRSWWLVAKNYSAFCSWIDTKVVRSVRKIQTIGFINYLKAGVQGKRAKAIIANSEKLKSDPNTMEYNGLLWLRGREKQEMIDENWPRTARYILKIRDLLASKNIPLVLVMYPHGIYVGKTEWNEGRKFWGFEQNKIYTDYYAFEEVGLFAEDEGIPFINAMDDFLLADKSKQYFFLNDGHMTPEGYKVVAESILKHPEFKNTYNATLPNALK